MIDLDQALASIAALDCRSRVRRVPLPEAAGRWAAAPVALDRDQPPFDRATMDGYAIAISPGAESYRVIGSVFAGESADRSPAAGEALRIMTGAPCPAGCTVLPIECTDGGEQQVRITEADALRPAANIAWRGEDGHAGDCVLAAGTRCTPATLAAAAMAGASELEVFEAPRLGLCTTGDELEADGEAGIADSNGPLLAAIADCLALPLQRRHAGDEPDRLREAMGELADSSELLICTGGVSAGARDLVPAIAEELGYHQVFHKVAVQPGKPVLLARHDDGRCMIGLPGNPVSVLATAHIFLLPLLGRFLGGWQPRRWRLPLTHAFTQRKGRTLFRPARLDEGGVTITPWNGSGDLLAAAAADGFVRIDAHSELSAGEAVEFLPYVGAPLGERAQRPPRAS